MSKQENLNMKKWLLPALTFGALFCACSMDTAGTSEEIEGAVALSDKRIVGVSQKGPLVKGSNVVLKETSADGSFTPTGKAFSTTTISDNGDFEFKGLHLEHAFCKSIDIAIFIDLWIVEI